MCEKTAIVTTTPLPSPSCTFGWTGYNDHCYQFFYNGNLNGFTANQACIQNGGYLMKIDNDGEFNWLQTAFGITTQYPNINIYVKEVFLNYFLI